VRANRAYDLLVRREGRVPAFLAGPDRRDRVEVVEVDSGEVVLIWDTEPRQTGRLSRALRADLAQLDAEAFMRKWRRWQPS
jgi:hypothetical protein